MTPEERQSFRRRILAAYQLDEDDLAGFEELERAEEQAEFERRAYVDFLRRWQEGIEARLSAFLEQEGRLPDEGELEVLMRDAETGANVRTG